MVKLLPKIKVNKKLLREVKCLTFKGFYLINKLKRMFIAYLQKQLFFLLINNFFKIILRQIPLNRSWKLCLNKLIINIFKKKNRVRKKMIKMISGLFSKNILIDRFYLFLRRMFSSLIHQKYQRPLLKLINKSFLSLHSRLCLKNN